MLWFGCRYDDDAWSAVPAYTDPGAVLAGAPASTGDRVVRAQHAFSWRTTYLTNAFRSRDAYCLVICVHDAVTGAVCGHSVACLCIVDCAQVLTGDVVHMYTCTYNVLRRDAAGFLQGQAAVALDPMMRGRLALAAAQGPASDAERRERARLS